MNTFFFIIKKIFDFHDTQINIQKIDFNQPYESHVKNNFSSLQSILFYMLYKQEYSIKNKYDFFFKTLQNIFLQSKDREEFINDFYRIQKTYVALSKLAQTHRFKKAKVMVDTDLSMNPITLKSRYTFCLIQNNNKYLFNVMDLINIINTNLSNSPMFFLEPLISKNPYNNIPFNKSSLYNIYFHIREKLTILPELFHKFFLLNFDLKEFSREYEYLIREHAINNFVNNSISSVLISNINIMIKNYNVRQRDKYKIHVDSNFPKKVFINIFKPYLKLYLTQKYSLIKMKRYTSKILLENKLKKFSKFNTLFGRKHVEMKYYFDKNGNKKSKISKVSFNDKHLSFYHKETNFMSSHTDNLYNVEYEQNINDSDTDDNDTNNDANNDADTNDNADTNNDEDDNADTNNDEYDNADTNNDEDDNADTNNDADDADDSINQSSGNFFQSISFNYLFDIFHSEIINQQNNYDNQHEQENSDNDNNDDNNDDYDYDDVDSVS